VSVVQAFMSLHVVGQLASQVSPGSVTPLPHVGMQSRSLFALQPFGQQPSLWTHITIGLNVHRTLHWDATPVRTSLVHAIPSLQDVGQFPSHVSFGSVTPLPQVEEQSESFAALHPSAQQPSPPAQAVTRGWVHTTLHSPGVPVSTSPVHGFPSSGQPAGQFPSQVSLPSTTSFPHDAAQSASLVPSQPSGQQPSASAHAVTGR
jgi:hypothetical protein